MGDLKDDAAKIDPQKPGKVAKIARGALQVAGGAVPIAGGVLSAIAGAWSEAEQDRQNRFFEHWIQMLKDELKEKEKPFLKSWPRSIFRMKKLLSGWRAKNINRW